MEKMVLGKEVMSEFEVLIDSDAFVGLFVEHDAHHQKTLELFQKFANDNVKIVATSFVVAETATVISKLSGQTAARKFLDYSNSGNLPIIHVDEAIQLEALKIFVEQEKKRTSVFDCANVAVMRLFGIPQIFSFDAVYSRKFDLKISL